MSRKGKREGKTTAKQRLSTRQLMNTRRITEYSLETYDGDELVYFMIRPTNLSVLSESSVGARVYALMNVLKGVAEIEMLCLNSPAGEPGLSVNSRNSTLPCSWKRTQE